MKTHYVNIKNEEGLLQIQRRQPRFISLQRKCNRAIFAKYAHILIHFSTYYLKNAKLSEKPVISLSLMVIHECGRKTMNPVLRCFAFISQHEGAKIIAKYLLNICDVFVDVLL